MWANGHHLAGVAAQQQQQQNPWQQHSTAFVPLQPQQLSQGILGHEESDHHRALLALAASIREGLRSSAQSNSATSSRAIQEKQLQDKLALFRSRIRELELLAEEQDDVDQARAVEEVVIKHKDEYERLRLEIGLAKRAEQAAVEQAFVQQRKELLAGAPLPVLLRKLAGESEAVAAAQEITLSLRRTRQELSRQLEHAAGNLELLKSGNKTLDSTRQELGSQVQALKEASQGLSTLKRQSQGDRWLLWVGLLLFMAVCGYVGFKRAPLVVKVPIQTATHLTYRGVLASSRAAITGASWAAQAAFKATRQSSSSPTQEDPPAPPPWMPPPDQLEPLASPDAGPGFAQQHHPQARQEGARGGRDSADPELPSHPHASETHLGSAGHTAHDSTGSGLLWPQPGAPANPHSTGWTGEPQVAAAAGASLASGFASSADLLAPFPPGAPAEHNAPAQSPHEERQAQAGEQEQPLAAAGEPLGVPQPPSPANHAPDPLPNAPPPCPAPSWTQAGLESWRFPGLLTPHPWDDYSPVVFASDQAMVNWLDTHVHEWSEVEALLTRLASTPERVAVVRRWWGSVVEAQQQHLQQQLSRPEGAPADELSAGGSAPAGADKVSALLSPASATHAERGADDGQQQQREQPVSAAGGQEGGLGDHHEMPKHEAGQVPHGEVKVAGGALPQSGEGKAQAPPSHVSLGSVALYMPEDTAEQRASYPWLFASSVEELADWMMTNIEQPQQLADWLPHSGLHADSAEQAWAQVLHMRAEADACRAAEGGAPPGAWPGSGCGQEDDGYYGYGEEGVPGEWDGAGERAMAAQGSEKATSTGTSASAGPAPQGGDALLETGEAALPEVEEEEEDGPPWHQADLQHRHQQQQQERWVQQQLEELQQQQKQLLQHEHEQQEQSVQQHWEQPEDWEQHQEQEQWAQQQWEWEEAQQQQQQPQEQQQWTQEQWVQQQWEQAQQQAQWEQEQWEQQHQQHNCEAGFHQPTEQPPPQVHHSEGDEGELAYLPHAVSGVVAREDLQDAQGDDYEDGDEEEEQGEAGAGGQPEGRRTSSPASSLGPSSTGPGAGPGPSALRPPEKGSARSVVLSGVKEPQ